MSQKRKPERGDEDGGSQVFKGVAPGTTTSTMLQWVATDPAVHGQDKLELMVIRFQTKGENM